MRKLQQLTGLRYFAAVAVFLSHLGVSQDGSIVGRVFAEGYIGVSFFFVLSGFVLSYSYADAITSGRIGFREYVLLRIVRLTPLHYLTALPFIFIGFEADWKNLSIIIANLLYLHSFFPDSAVYFSLNAPSWSLSNEMFFYLCFFFLAPPAVRNLLKMTAALLGIVLLCAILAYRTIPEVTIAGTMPFDHWLFYIFPGFRMLEFMSGMILFHLWRNGFVARRILFPISIMFTALLMSVAAEIPEEFRYSLLYLPAVCLVLCSSLSLEGSFNKLLSSKAAVLLGNASFAFYLIHVPVLRILQQETMLGWMLDGGVVFQSGFLLASLALVSAASILLHLLYDEPVGTFLRKKVIRSNSQGALQMLDGQR